MTAYANMDQQKNGFSSSQIKTPKHKRNVRVSPATTLSPGGPSSGSNGTIPSNRSPASSLSHRRNDQAEVPATTSAVANDLCHVFGVFFAVLVRLLLLSFCLLTVSLVVSQLGEVRYWALAACSVLLVIEGIVTVVKRLGQERKWICLCFVCYLLACVPSIWLLELKRLDKFESVYANASSQVSISVSGISADIRLNSDLALNIVEQCLVFLLIFCRWILPRGDITRDQLSQLLFVFIGMASDVMELFQLFDETQVRQNRELTYVILAVWTLSLFQFTLVLTMSHSPKKVRVALDESGVEEGGNSQERKKSLIQKFTYTEMWSLVVNICMQDGPFLAVRLYVLINYNLINYSIIFFVCKNVLVVLLLLYRLLVICLSKMEDDDDKDDADEGDAYYNKNRRPSAMMMQGIYRNRMEHGEDDVRRVGQTDLNTNVQASPVRQRMGSAALTDVVSHPPLVPNGNLNDRQTHASPRKYNTREIWPLPSPGRRGSNATNTVPNNNVGRRSPGQSPEHRNGNFITTGLRGLSPPGGHQWNQPRRASIPPVFNPNDYW